MFSFAKYGHAISSGFTQRRPSTDAASASTSTGTRATGRTGVDGRFQTRQPNNERNYEMDDESMDVDVVVGGGVMKNLLEGTFRQNPLIPSSISKGSTGRRPTTSSSYWSVGNESCRPPSTAVSDESHAAAATAAASSSSKTPSRRGNTSTFVTSDGFKTPHVPSHRTRRSVLASGITDLNTTPGGKSSSVTPKSSSSRTLVESVDTSVVLAIVEGRGQARGEVGMACFQTNTSNVILCQFSDTQTYTKVIAKVNIYRPFEILMPTTCCEGSGTPSQLYLQLKKEVSNVSIIPVQRKIFSEAKGYTRLKEIVAEQFIPVIHLITQKYYCLSAAAALLKYVELVQSIIFSPRTIKIEFQGSEKTCMIDTITAQHLELLQNNHRPVSAHSLLGILSTCRTPSGSRLLRMNILQPPCDLKLVQTRLDCIEELMDSREILHGLQDLLGRLSVDIEHVISTLIQIPRTENDRITEQKINYVIALKHTLELLPNFITALENTQNPFFQSIREDFKSSVFEEMFEKIQRVLDEEAHIQKGSTNMKRQRCFAVKADVNAILDIARSAYIEIMNDMNEYVVSLSQQYNLPFRLGQNNKRGFFIQLLLPGRGDRMPNFPNNFLQVRKLRNVVTFTTEILLTIDHRIQEITKEIENISSLVISELLASIRSDIGSLYKISEAIANLDILYALANYSLTTLRSVRPQFSDHATAITMGRHPVLENVAEFPPVPNSTLFTTDANFAIITGPNMSGKTTYLKQVATLQILAQLGSFVPAESATFRLASNIFSRIGTGDNIEGGTSSFELEMTEMNYILSNVNDNSLVIIDELGRATSVEEGTAISWAIAEALLKTKSFVLFATHYLFLTKLEVMYPNVLNYALEAQEWVKFNDGNEVRQADADEAMSSRPFNSCKLKYTHILKRGVTKVEYYGVKLANNSSYPTQVVQRSAAIAENIISKRKKSESEVTSDGPPRQALLMLTSQLYLASKVASAVSEEDLQLYMNSLQEEFFAKYGRPTRTQNQNEEIVLSSGDESSLIEFQQVFPRKEAESSEKSQDEVLNDSFDSEESELRNNYGASKFKEPKELVSSTPENTTNSPGSEIDLMSEISWIGSPNTSSKNQQSALSVVNGSSTGVTSQSVNLQHVPSFTSFRPENGLYSISSESDSLASTASGGETQN